VCIAEVRIGRNQERNMSNVEPEDPADELAGLREAARESKANRAENEALKRRLAFSEAGIPRFEDMADDDPNKNLTSMFTRSYDGEMTAEAIRADAAGIGLLDRVATGTEDRQPTAAEIQGQSMRADFAGGTPVPPQGDAPAEHPADVNLRAFHESVANGLPREQAAMNYVAGMINNSADDERLFFDQQAHDAEASAYDATTR
jgi:hypothetical protein